VKGAFLQREIVLTKLYGGREREEFCHGSLGRKERTNPTINAERFLGACVKEGLAPFSQGEKRGLSIFEKGKLRLFLEVREKTTGVP